jgi:hypothetical protein
MNSKAIALFLSLGLVTTLAACNGAANQGGEEAGDSDAVPTEQAPASVNEESPGGAVPNDPSASPAAETEKPSSVTPSATNDEEKSEDVNKDTDTEEAGEAESSNDEGGEGGEGE